MDLASEEPERLPCLQRLLDLGADVNAADKNGKRDAERLRALLRAAEMAVWLIALHTFQRTGVHFRGHTRQLTAVCSFSCKECEGLRNTLWYTNTHADKTMHTHTHFWVCFAFLRQSLNT